LAVTKTRRFLAEAALLYAAAIWGSTFFVVKDALDFVDPVVLVGIRFTIAGILLGAWLCWRRVNMLAQLRHGLVLGVILWVLYITQTVGLGITTASNSGFITGLFIVFVPLVNWLWLHKVPKVRHIVAVLLALGGLWLLTGGIEGINAGDIMTLAAAVTYALHVAYAGRCMEEAVDPWVLNFQQILLIGLLSLATAAVQGGLKAGPAGIPIGESLAAQFAVTSSSAWWVLVFLAVFPTITAYVAQLYGQQVVDATRAALIFTMEPVFAAAFAWTLGGELFKAENAFGGGLMVVAMVVSGIDWRRLKASLGLVPVNPP